MDKPSKCISVHEARELQNNWKKTRGREIERGQGYMDTREFWYSLAELEEYIEFVKKKSEEQGARNPGLRIYLGAYPAQDQKKSLSTIFITPTFDESSTKSGEETDEVHLNNYSIDPMNDSQNGWPPREY